MLVLDTALAEIRNFFLKLTYVKNIETDMFILTVISLTAYANSCIAPSFCLWSSLRINRHRTKSITESWFLCLAPYELWSSQKLTFAALFMFQHSLFNSFVCWSPCRFFWTVNIFVFFISAHNTFRTWRSWYQEMKVIVPT